MKHWKALKTVISNYSIQKDLFLALITREGDIVCINSQMQRSLDLDNPREIPVNIFQIINPDQVNDFQAVMEQTRTLGLPGFTQVSLKNGSYHPMQWQIDFVALGEKRQDHYLCAGYLAEDASVDESLQIMSEGIDEARLFRSFLDQTPNLAWILDEEGKLVFANQSFFQHLEIEENNALHKSIFTIIPRHVAETLYLKHVKVLETGQAQESVEKIKWSDGSNFTFHVNVFPVNSITGRKMIGGHAVNMADKYQVEQQLRQANERLLLLSRATSDAIWEWDMQTGYIFRNDALMDLIGYNNEDAKGLSWWLRRIHPEDRNRVTDKIKDATDKGQHSWEDEYRFKCLDGEYKHIHDRGYVVYENGLPVKMIGSLQDITELKQLENQLIEEKLQRQKEISETVIRVQEKERTRIGYELHDNVNQILSTTRLFVEMLTPSTEEEMKLKDKSLEYLLSAIEEIRKLSKELVVPHLKEKGLVESIYTLIEDIELSGKLKIKFVYDAESNQLSQGKKVTIFRIVQEQFKNILKYSQAKHVDIYLHCRANKFELGIKDDGIGFDPKKTPRGIGLSNIHDRARFYNGSAEIISEPGKGCQVIVAIPAN